MHLSFFKTLHIPHYVRSFHVDDDARRHDVKKNYFNAAPAVRVNTERMMGQDTDDE